MIIVLENELLRIEASTLGAELQSIVGKKTGFEYLWQGDAQYWQNRATVLFPICGRLREGVYTYEGKTYEMCLHGFAKLMEFQVAEQSANSVLFELCANEETKKIYPFDFCFGVRYTLTEKTVCHEFIVKNTGNGDLPFSFGGHPGFNIPFVAGESFTDYYLEFGQERSEIRRRLSDGLFGTKETAPYQLRDGKFIDLQHSLFDNDAIFFEQTAKSVSLKSTKNDRAVTVDWEDLEAVGFWHKPLTEAPYVCIEPWHGIPTAIKGIDDFATKVGFIHLDAGKTYTTAMRISITE